MGGLRSIGKKISHAVQSWTENPVKAIYNATLGNAHDAVVGTGQLIGKSGVPGSKMVQNSLEAFAPWDYQELQRPGQTFYNRNNQAFENAPEQIEPYMPAITTAALSFVNPFLGAAYNTAYQGGAMQANQKGMNWGDLAKTAAINFGTAAAASALNGAAASGNASANAANTGKTLSAVNTANSSNNALSAFGGGATTYAAPSTASMSAAVPVGTYSSSALSSSMGTYPSSTTASNGGAAAPAQQTPVNSTTMASQTPVNATTMSAQTPTSGDALSTFSAPSSQGAADWQPTLLKQAQSGFGNQLRTAAAKTGTEMTNQALNATLAPSQATAISDGTIAQDPYGLTGLFDQGGSMQNSVLAKFGGPVLEAPTGKGQQWITQDDINKASDASYAQSLLGLKNLDDQYMDWGRGGDYKSTPEYQKAVADLWGSYDKSLTDITKEANQTNEFKNFLDQNSLTVDTLKPYIDYSRTLPATDPGNINYNLLSPFYGFYPTM